MDGERLSELRKDKGLTQKDLKETSLHQMMI